MRTAFGYALVMEGCPGLAGKYLSLVQETTAEVTRQTPWQRSNSQRTFVLTNFYPSYDRANDQVDRVVPVRRTIFQRVISRYRLSTSETRDEELGPAFIDVPCVTSSRSGKAGGSRSP